MTDFSTVTYLAQLAQDCVMTDHHLDTLQAIATPPPGPIALHGIQLPAPSDQVFPIWERAAIQQVRRSWRLALQFQAGLDALADSE